MCDNERGRESDEGSQEYSVTADERQTCRQGQSQILLFKTLHLYLIITIDIEKESEREREKIVVSVLLTEVGLALITL